MFLRPVSHLSAIPRSIHPQFSSFSSKVLLIAVFGSFVIEHQLTWFSSSDRIGSGFFDPRTKISAVPEAGFGWCCSTATQAGSWAPTTQRHFLQYVTGDIACKGSYLLGFGVERRNRLYDRPRVITACADKKLPICRQLQTGALPSGRNPLSAANQLVVYTILR